MRLDFTLTLPGMFEVDAMNNWLKNWVWKCWPRLSSVSHQISSMSPLALPRHILDPWVDELAGRSAGAMRDVLLQLKNRPCFEEQWPDQYQEGLRKGKARVLQLEQIRTQVSDNDRYPGLASRSTRMVDENCLIQLK
jgi:hypothetical protein